MLINLKENNKSEKWQEIFTKYEVKMLECWEYTYIYVCVWKLTYNESVNTVWKPDFWMKKGQYMLVTKPLKLTFFGRKKKKKQNKFLKFKVKHESTRKQIWTLGKDTSCIILNMRKQPQCRMLQDSPE